MWARLAVTLPTGEARAFGDWCVSDIKASTVKAFQTLRQVAGIVAANPNLAFQVSLEKADGPPGDRTRDTLIKSQVLYH